MKNINRVKIAFGIAVTLCGFATPVHSQTITQACRQSAAAYALSLGDVPGSEVYYQDMLGWEEMNCENPNDPVPSYPPVCTHIPCGDYGQ